MKETENTLRRGLILMLDSDTSETPRKAFEQVGLAAARLEKHPAGLSIEFGLTEISRRHYGTDIFLLQSPGITSTSVRSMATVARSIASNGVGRNDFRYLRSMEAGTAVYFEIGSEYGVFICGGCDKYSGEGRYGKKQLDWLFEFIVHMFGVPNEHHVVPPTMEATLRQVWREHDQARLPDLQHT